MDEKLLVPEEKLCGTHIQRKETMFTILSWSEYSPKTKQGKATETTWKFNDTEQKVVLKGVAIFSGSNWETGFTNPTQYVPVPHQRKARQLGRERYHKQRFRGLVLSELDLPEVREDLEDRGKENQCELNLREDPRLAIRRESPSEEPEPELYLESARQEPRRLELNGKDDETTPNEETAGQGEPLDDFELDVSERCGYGGEGAEVEANQKKTSEDRDFEGGAAGKRAETPEASCGLEIKIEDNNIAMSKPLKGEVDLVKIRREASEEGLTPWIQQLGSEAEAERLRTQIALVKHGQAAVLPLIAVYAGGVDAQVKERIVAVLGLIGGDAVDALIQQLVEGDPGRQECARQALPRIAASLPNLLALRKTHPNLTSVAQAILHELAANLGYPSLDQLLTEYKSFTQQADLPTSTQLSYELRVKRMLEALEEAQECFNSDLYSQTILTCDWVIQQLLMAILEFFRLNLGNDANKLPIVISTLHNIKVRLRTEKELRWLRILRNDLRYELKSPTKREANQALRVARHFAQEVKNLLGLRF